MDVIVLQQRLRAFAVARDWQPFHTPKNLAMALMVEAGELLELFQWLTTTESRSLTRTPQNKERVADEIADVMLYLLQLADHTDVDVEQAVKNKLRKNAEKYPAVHAEQSPPTQPSLPAISRRHLLVDWENVQPEGDVLRELVPEATDVWLFHGPQQKVDASSHQQAFGEGRVTLVPRSGNGKNALDFHLTWYAGYLCARKPPEAVVVVSNDHGYDPMLEHARLLGFDALRREMAKPVVVEKKVATSKSAATKSTTAASAKASRAEVQALLQSLQTIQATQRPAQREVLIGFIQTQLHEIGAPSAKVVHAVAQLQAQKHIVIKGDGVCYPSFEQGVGASSQNAPTPTSAKVPAKKVAVAKKKAGAKVAVAKPITPAQIVRRVEASLKKMSGNRPAREAGLLKHIATHVPTAENRAVIAQEVYALLQVEQKVQISAEGGHITYPGLT